MLSQTNAKIVIGGGDQKHGEYLVLAVDYNGDVIDEKWLDDGDEYTLPTPPEHDNLVFQEWSCTQTPINNKVTVDKKDIMIGAVYTTASGKNEFDIILNQRTGLDVTLNMDGTKEWGDGTSDTNTTHTYTDYGEYTIKCNGTNITLQSSYGIFGQQGSYEIQYNKYCVAMRIATVSNIPEYALRACKELQYCILSKTVMTIRGGVFKSCGGLKVLILPTTVGSPTNLGSLCSGCLDLSAVVIPYGNITTIGGYCFETCVGLKNFVLPDSITSFGDNQRSIYGCYSLERVFLSKSLTRIYSETFQYCYDLKEITYPDNVTYITATGGYVCYELEKVIFPKKLTYLGGVIPSSAPNLILLDFRKVEQVPDNGESKSNLHQYFYKANPLIEVLVPWDLWLDWITSAKWETIKECIKTDGNTVVNFLNSNDSDIYIYGKKISNSSVIWKYGSKMPYCCYNTLSDTLIAKTQTNIPKDSEIDITLDFSNSKKITLSTGVSGLSVEFYINGAFFNALEDNGDYYINLVSDVGTEIKYIIQGGSNYLDEEDIITTTGEDITESITLTPATEQTFVRPDLTANGTMGGDSFAVNDPFYQNYYSKPYQAVDSSASTYWYGGSTDYNNNVFEFYNPNEIKISELALTFSGNYYASGVKIEGGNDYVLWEDLPCVVTGTGANQVVSLINNTKYYKYYKITFKIRNDYSNPYLYLINLAITATEKVATI